MGKKITISTGKFTVVEISKNAYSREKVVYIAVANKPIKYGGRGKSRIAYIGMSKRGAQRITESAFTGGLKLFGEHGFRRLSMYIVSCKPKKHVASWKELETALLHTFLEMFGNVPMLNHQGKNRPWDYENQFFSDSRLRSIIKYYSTIT